MKFEDGTDLPLRRRRGIECQELDDELLVTDVPADRAHFLNATMAAVWKLCDGTRTADQIAKSLAEIFDCSPADDLGRVAREALQTLADLNLLSASADPDLRYPG
ncbi:MAG: PqqD family protein [bacterium]|nr:PqqD family protein [bacterium]